MFQLFNTASDDKTIKSISSSDYEKILPVKDLNINDDIKNNKDKAFIIKTDGENWWYYYNNILSRSYIDGNNNRKEICSIICCTDADDEKSIIFIMENNMKIEMWYNRDKIIIKMDDFEVNYPKKRMKWIYPK